MGNSKVDLAIPLSLLAFPPLFGGISSATESASPVPSIAAGDKAGLSAAVGAGIVT
jgi:hypothetical protein